MGKFLINYTLNLPDRSYDELITGIKKYAWVNVGRSSWAVSTSSTASQIRDDLKRFIDINDSLFVAEIEGSWASFHLPPKVAEWLKIH
jgi:hypothetical protein